MMVTTEMMQERMPFGVKVLKDGTLRYLGDIWNSRVELPCEMASTSFDELVRIYTDKVLTSIEL